MEHKLHSPRRLLLIGLAATAALIGIVALIALLLVKSGTHENTGIVSNKPAEPQIATAAEVNQNLSDLEELLKQSAANQATTSAAINDKQVKVGS